MEQDGQKSESILFNIVPLCSTLFHFAQKNNTLKIDKR